MTTIHKPLSYFYQLYPICTAARAKCFSMNKLSHKSTLIHNSSQRNEKRFFCLQSAEKQEVSRTHPKPGGCSPTWPGPLGAAKRYKHIWVFSSHSEHSSAYPKISYFSPRKYPQEREGALGTAELGLCSRCTEGSTRSLPLREHPH